MSLIERIEADVKSALRKGDKQRLSTLRMLKSKLQEKQVALRGDRGVDYRMTDDEASAVIASYAKQRRDSISSYEQGGREELAARERAELGIVEEYLPKQLSDAEIRAVVEQAIVETGASSPREMGAVMKLVMAEVKGAADGKRVQQIVRESLGRSG